VIVAYCFFDDLIEQRVAGFSLMYIFAGSKDFMLLSRFSEYEFEAGVDEAGRGALAGPVVAGAVILPPDYFNENIKDSKLLNEATRELLAHEIKQNAIAWAVGIISVERIDQVNILNASLEAMHQAIQQLQPQAQFLIVDGNKFHHPSIPFQTFIKGDNRYLAIAAASILAKTHRDQLMSHLHEEFPMYNWKQNKGYPTIHHRTIIESHGRCNHHRRSFQHKQTLTRSLFLE
jgi:ribonuclease HII